MKKNIDVLWLIEHVAREMDVACAVKALAEAKYGINIVIRNIYLHAKESLREYAPAVVVHPFFYFAAGALATEDYVNSWPQAIHFNLAWEEIFYSAHKEIKAPSDEFTKKQVLHYAWGDFYKNYLMEHGVPPEHIYVSGNPAYQLYKDPYKLYFKGRDRLAAVYSLNKNTRWIFVPENYRWAFIGSKIELFEKLGGDRDEIIKMRDFSVESLKLLLQFCNETASDEEIEIIFRPRPATNSRIIKNFFKQNIGDAAPNLHFLKEESVREWILASDVVISSYSTSLIEAAIAGKNVYMFEPIEIPESLQYDWFQHVQRILSAKEFAQACLSDDGGNVALKEWAENEMLANGDPIASLATIVSMLVGKSRCKKYDTLSFSGFAQGFLKKLATAFNRNKTYFNAATHENDVFSEQDITRRVESWHRVLLR